MKVIIIGMDLDGTIFQFLFQPRKPVVKKMQAMKEQGCRFVIITRRPLFVSWLTKLLLILHRVPFHRLFCVGIGKGANERKLKVINDEKIEVFVDSNNRVVEFMKINSINAANTLEYFN